MYNCPTFYEKKISHFTIPLSEYVLQYKKRTLKNPGDIFFKIQQTNFEMEEGRADCIFNIISRTGGNSKHNGIVQKCYTT